MNRTLVIAEAGVNHNGDFQLALKLVDAATQAGADVVKFQTFQADELVTIHAEKAAYQKIYTSEAEAQRDMLRQLQLTPQQHLRLIQHCKASGIEFLSTAFDLASIDLLASMGLRCWKIPSGEITNLPYLRKIGSLRQPIILSCGMATLGEVEAAIDVLEHSGASRADITVLHCTTEYPAPLDEVNLTAMQTIARSLGVAVGYSDHTDGIVVSIAAVALGATVIEKHLTLDRAMAGPDHRASLEPQQFKSMVEGIRSIESALGDGIKRPTPCELANLSIARKSVVASRPIQAGETFTAHNLTSKRPGFGISPMQWDSLIGRKASRAYDLDDLIEW
jgi:N-acetylneuraminate synthase